ncbi:MAG: methyl-viologen-reducing hydrogenase subunit delta [Desulfobacterales bacterium S5133MH16]|nr:MAG: methyl-viologen-reducing hydrogenase subunit delta [Desulfobacterales bacterium S5133MH16]
MCSGRVDLEFILRAFSNGQDGVFIGGCKLDECNYVTHGNYDALANTYITKRILKHIGLNPERLRIEFMTAADGNLLAEYTDDFSKKVKELGPLGKAEGIDKEELKLKLEAARKLVPYMRLVERERLRVPVKSKEAYTEFFESSEINALFDEIFSEKLAVSQIMLLLKAKPLSTSDISEKLGLNPSDVARHMISSSRHGLVRYDEPQNCYALV